MAPDEQPMTTEMRPPLRSRRRATTRQEIADAALTLFERQGYSGTTVEQIADAAGISLRTFYRHCASKDEVLSAHLETGPAELAAAVGSKTDLSLLEAVIAAFVDVSGARARRRELRIMVGAPALRSAWLAAGREAQDDLVEIISNRYPEYSALHARARAAAITGVLTTVIETWALEDDQDLESITREALRVIARD